MIDLRSDTITKPTPEMRKVIAEAEVGDDVHGDDPTVKKLEQRTAQILGKPAALYVPSGIMANQIALRTHTTPGDEILLDANAHIYYYEAGAPAALSGVMCRLLNGERGIFTPDDVKRALRPKDIHFPRTTLVCLENTHNRGGGSIWPIQLIADVEKTARHAHLKLHLDGARLWNASAATGIPESEYAHHFDSVSVCYSKGLGAPIGSALVGSEEFIDRARHYRRQFGGGMRQAGIIAAGALYALENHRKILRQDHKNAQTLARALAPLPGIQLDPDTVETNIIFFKVTAMTAPELAQKLHDAGVYVLALGPDSIRLVTHLDVSADQINQAIEIFTILLKK